MGHKQCPADSWISDVSAIVGMPKEKMMDENSLSVLISARNGI